MSRPEPTIPEMQDDFERRERIAVWATFASLGLCALSVLLGVVAIWCFVACLAAALAIFGVQLWAQATALRMLRAIWQREREARAR